MPAIPTITVVNNENATATVTIAGADGGTTNTIQTLKVDSAWPATTWVTRNSRSGNGTIVVACGVGTFFFAVSSADGGEETWSPPVMGIVNSGGESLYSQIMDAVATRVRLLSLDGVDSANVSEHPVQTLHLIWEVKVSSALIGPYEGAVQQMPDGGSTRNSFAYPILISLVAPANQETTHANKWFLWTERIRNAFVDLPLELANGCAFSAEYVPMPAFDKQWWKQNAAATFVALRFRTLERKGM